MNKLSIDVIMSTIDDKFMMAVKNNDSQEIVQLLSKGAHVHYDDALPRSVIKTWRQYVCRR